MTDNEKMLRAALEKLRRVYPDAHDESWDAADAALAATAEPSAPKCPHGREFDDCYDCMMGPAKPSAPRRKP